MVDLNYISTIQFQSKPAGLTSKVVAHFPLGDQSAAARSRENAPV
jgi:hypothetical protein